MRAPALWLGIIVIAMGTGMSRRHRIAFLALGTRGDVQPLALLAAETLRQDRKAEAHVITHAAHNVSVPGPMMST